MRDGEYVPIGDTQVSSVMLFKKEANTSPSSILEASSGLVSNSAALDAVWRWSTSGSIGGRGPSGVMLSESQYTETETSSCSGIYNLGDGRLAVILNGVNNVSSLLEDGTSVSSNTQLSGEPAARYIDVWTVKLCDACDWTTFINETEFFQNNAVVLTERLLFNTKERLYTKKIQSGEKIDMVIGTEITIENKDIDDSIKNLLKGGLITTASVQIIRHNEDPSLESRAVFRSFADTTDGITMVTGDNTFVYKLDTTSNPKGIAWGGNVGTYSIQVKYAVLDQTILSPLMYFTIE